MLPVHCTTQDRQLETGTPDFIESVSAEIAAAVPAGATVARSQAAFLRAVDEHPNTALLRVDALEHVRAVAWVVASTAAWSTLTARPTWPVLMERTGLSRASVARWLRWLRARGLLGVVESGTTPRFAPMALAAGAENRAALYVLCVSARDVDKRVELPGEREVSQADGTAAPGTSVEESETPTFLVFDLQKSPYPSARANGSVATVVRLQNGEKRSDKPGSGSWARCAVAGSRRDRLGLAERLQAEAPALRPATARSLRSVLLPWLARPELGWTVAELLYAIDHTPDGQAHTFTAAVKIPDLWLAHRMQAWLDESGRPLPAPAVAAAGARAAEQATATQARSERRDQVQRIEDDHAFGDRVRDVAGERYPALVEAVMGSQIGAARLLPTAGADALVREAVRDVTGSSRGSGGSTAAAIAVAVDELLTHRDRPGT